MQSFADENNIDDQRAACAGAIIDVVPVLMHKLRAFIRREFHAELTMAQFRVMAYVATSEGASLTDVADFLGLCPSSASKLIDTLATRGLLDRNEAPEDRRRMMLSVTDAGMTLFHRIHHLIKSYLVERLAESTQDDVLVIRQGMERLLTLFPRMEHGHCHVHDDAQPAQCTDY